MYRTRDPESLHARERAARSIERMLSESERSRAVSVTGVPPASARACGEPLLRVAAALRDRDRAASPQLLRVVEAFLFDREQSPFYRDPQAARRLATALARSATGQTRARKARSAASAAGPSSSVTRCATPGITTSSPRGSSSASSCAEEGEVVRSSSPLKTRTGLSKRESGSRQSSIP